MAYQQIQQLKVDSRLVSFVREHLLAELSDISEEQFFAALQRLSDTFSPRIRAALAERERIGGQIDQWHSQRAGDGATQIDQDEYIRFLTEIGYLEDVPPQVEVTAGNVDAEIREMFGPQLVVPASNARFALNAANARWGSLYDALYGSDALEPLPTDNAGYDQERGAMVVAYVARLLDDWIALQEGSHAAAVKYCIEAGEVSVTLASGETTGLRAPEQFIGFQGTAAQPSSLFFTHHGLRCELRFDASHPVGAAHDAALFDVRIEAALTTIIDFEDSVADVDAQDKVITYANWLGLMKGDLAASFTKGGKTLTRQLEHDRCITQRDGSLLTLPGRAVLLVRNVGHHMFTDAVVDANGDNLPEGLLDALVSATAALHDLRKTNNDNPLDERRLLQNSRTGSVYVVKPKMHGSAEVRLACDIFTLIEEMLALPKATIKIGIMDEERRTSVNLRACLQAAAQRAVFINTGFLDRTGDEIHTSMCAGAMVRKADMQQTPWLAAYERHNVTAGLACGLSGRGQIGKGMWARPDDMKAMLAAKVKHLEAGGSTAWVPSPTAATLHALHYHSVDVAAVQRKLSGAPPTERTELLAIPLATGKNWSAEEINAELENNAQSILGYVVRWIDQGIGCSKVPDTNNIALMEDRATLRISSQHIANWLKHGVCSEQQVRNVLAKMAAVVDEQNRDDPAYRPMASNQSGVAFRAACDLIFEGEKQPNGYTEYILTRYRREAKAAAAAR